jgi:mRNA-degrading endonuclease RelE of RelBE toxin-antitoxin system
MEIILKKQPQKYLASVDTNAREKLYKALNGLAELDGNIVKLRGKTNVYRLKIDHYRVIFEYDSKKGQIIIVTTINTRTNIKY